MLCCFNQLKTYIHIFINICKPLSGRRPSFLTLSMCVFWFYPWVVRPTVQSWLRSTVWEALRDNFIYSHSFARRMTNFSIFSFVYEIYYEIRNRTLCFYRPICHLLDNGDFSKRYFFIFNIFIFKVVGCKISAASKSTWSRQY